MYETKKKFVSNIDFFTALKIATVISKRYFSIATVIVVPDTSRIILIIITFFV